MIQWIEREIPYYPILALLEIVTAKANNFSVVSGFKKEKIRKAFYQSEEEGTTVRFRSTGTSAVCSGQ